MIWARHLKLCRKVGVAALALGALATGGNAQDSFQGKFTHAASWRLHFHSVIRQGSIQTLHPWTSG
jgi:hypothetical protein